MKLDFNILWFDDQPRRTESAQDRLRQRLLRDGFELSVRMISEFTDVEAVIKAAHDEGDVDLILIDYHLGQTDGGDGDELARQVRRRFDYKDIIFYSSHVAGLPQLRKLMYDAEIDGAYCVMRNNLAEETHAIIQSIVKKVVDLDHMRGIVMAATSDLDNVVKECLVSAHSALGSKARKAACSKIISSLLRQLNGNIKKINKLDGTDKIEDLLKLHNAVFSATPRYHALLSALKEWDGHGEHGGKHALLSNYHDEVITPRNGMAHVKPVTNGGRRVLQGAEGLEVTDASMAQLRGRLLQHRQNFIEIAGVLGVDLDGLT